MHYPLLTQRLSIEPLSLSDLDAFVSYRQDPEIARFQSWETTYSAIQALELVNSQEGVLLPEAGNWLQLGVRDRSTGELLGDLALHSLADEVLVFELGFTFARQHQGKGFAREAASKLLEVLFGEFAAKRVIANSDSRNLPSMGLLTSLGFENRPEKSWTEPFKGETVTVQYFEKTHL